MPRPDEPTSPLDAYRQIIDQLAGETVHEGSANILRRSGTYSKANEHAEFNAFLGQLTPGQREVVSRMLDDCRDDAIHDVLALMEWWTTCGEVAFTFKGEPIPLHHYECMHMDYVGRRMGNPWPGDEDIGPPQSHPKSSHELAQIAELDAKLTDNTCPHCGQPCPSYRMTCKHCRKSVRGA